MKRLIYILLALAIAIAAPAQKRKTQGGGANRSSQVKQSGNAKSQKAKQAKSSTKDSKGKKPQKAKSSAKLKDEKADVEKKMQKNQRQLQDNKQQQADKQRTIEKIEGQIRLRAEHIHELELRIDTIEVEVRQMQTLVDSLNVQLNLKKERYAQALRYARWQSLNLSPTVFVLAGSTPSEMVRRARYAKQYATYQHQLGEDVMTKRAEMQTAQSRLLAKKDELNCTLQDIIQQRKQLTNERQQQKDVLSGLVKAQQNLDQELERQRKQIDELNKEIERQVAYEIEQARKQAEEERRRREAAAKKSNAGAKTAANRGGTGKATPSKTGNATGKTGSGNSGWQTSADRSLSGSFAQNKGRLPVPITGQYMVTGRYGKYTPPGTKGVQLFNKGMFLTGKEGARARVVFDGIVSAVVSMGGKQHVLVRHGSYITVYCNLKSVIVHKGQALKARDLLGAVATDDQGRYTLQFQLHHEKNSLDPQPWLAR